jgi:alkaline phosphatase
LYQELRQKGVTVSDFQEKALKELSPDPKSPFAWFSALGEPDSVQAGRDYLPLSARMATEYLSKRSGKGFFLMLEGSQIDWACHAKDGNRAVAEMLDFDQAVGEILKFAEADGQTLVIVTADHETGGMVLEQGEGFEVLDLEFNSGQHTASLVPVYAFGPGAEQFGGVFDNTEIYWRMARLWGYAPEAVSPVSGKKQ